MADAFGQFREGSLKCCSLATADGIGDRPVKPRGLAEFFMGEVADSDDEVVGLQYVGKMARPQPGKRQSVSSGHVDGSRIDRRRRMGSSGGGRDRAAAPPQCGSELRASGVTGAHEQHPLGCADRPGLQGLERVQPKVEVGAAAVALGAPPFHETRRLERLEVVGEQVGGHLEHRCQFRGGGVAED